jgi:hypothetical protein
LANAIRRSLLLHYPRGRLFSSGINGKHVVYVMTRNAKETLLIAKINKKSIQSEIAIFKSTII